MPLIRKYLAALDLGTNNCKASFYDLESGIIYSTIRKYGLLYLKNGWVEQNPEVWYCTALECLAELVKRAGIGGCEIVALCVSGTNGLVLVDELGVPVYNAVMFSDRRSERQALALDQRYGKRLSEIAGNRAWPGTFTLPLLNWFREERPDLWQRTAKFLTPAGYVIMRLTGKTTIDTSRASMTLFFNQAQRVWSKEILAKEQLIEEILPDLFEPWEVIGEVSQIAARKIGIKEETQVLAGCVDSVAAAVGTGVLASDKALMILGTTGRVIFSSNRHFFDDQLINQCHAVTDRWISTGAMSNAGGSLKWLVDTLAPLETAMESRLGQSSYQIVDSAAAQSPAGSNGIIFLPYLGGERSPLWNSRAKGTFFGLAGETVWPDLARSVLEGVAFALKNNLNALEQSLNIRAGSLIITGGGVQSCLWCQILADVLERPVEIPEIPLAETLGGIILAGCTVKHWGSVAEAAGDLVKIKARINPESGNFQVYRERYSLFNRLYQALLPIY